MWAVAHSAVLIASNRAPTPVIDTITSAPVSGDADAVYPVLLMLLDAGGECMLACVSMCRYV